MLYIGNNKIIKGYIGNTPIAYAGFGKSELIKIEGEGGEEVYPENTVAVYTVSGTSPVSPYSVTDKASDWLEVCRDNGNGTSTMIITASTPPTAISFQDITQLLLSVEYVDTSRVTNMNYMFYNCSNLTSVNCSNWDTSNVTNMISMFYGCTSLTKLDLSSFNTSKITNMNSMFRDCTSLTSLGLSSFDTSNVTNMNYMFYNCSSLTSLNFENLNLSKMPYTTSGANYKYNCSSMFTNCTALTELRLDNCNKTTLLMVNLDRQPMSYGGYKQYYADLPTYSDGSVHNMYFKKSNWSTSTNVRTGWTINYVEE